MNDNERREAVWGGVIAIIVISTALWVIYTFLAPEGTGDQGECIVTSQEGTC